jgi:hypothetical protein
MESLDLAKLGNAHRRLLLMRGCRDSTNWHLLGGVLGSLGGAALYPLIYHW